MAARLGNFTKGGGWIAAVVLHEQSASTLLKPQPNRPRTTEEKILA